MKDLKHRTISQRQDMAKVRSRLGQLLGPDVSVFTQDLSLTGFSASRGFPVEFVLQGTDWNKLVATSKPLLQKLAATGLVTDLNSDFLEGMPEVLIVPDRDEAARHGVTVSSIGQEVANLIGGDLFNANTEYPKQGHRYYIRLRGVPDDTSSLDDLNLVYLRNNIAQAN